MRSYTVAFGGGLRHRMSIAESHTDLLETAFSLRHPEYAETAVLDELLNIPAVEIGLRFLDRVGIETIHARVAALGGALLDLTAVPDDLLPRESC